MGEVLFEDIFTIYAIDKEGKKFDKVSRIEARSEQFDMHMTLDVNIDVYPVAVGEKFTVATATTLNLDGTPDTGYYVSGRKTLADKYEYVMYGKLYKIDESHESGANAKVEIYVSYGGLLMLLKGEPSHMNFFQLDQRLFLLMRKV